MTRLLVSVRSVEEAEAALAGGADLIDVKEPLNGSLGKSDNSVIAAVLRHVDGRRPVSAALGEWLDWNDGELPVAGVRFLKWGLYQVHRLADIAAAFTRLRSKCHGCELVTVAYADWDRAAAAPPQALCAMACEGQWGPFLIDTWAKDGSTLLNWLSVNEIDKMVSRCRGAGVPVALAGSLGWREMQALAGIGPDWFAVRGAVCQERNRASRVDRNAVRRLADWLHDHSIRSNASHEN
jgi:uncharacterized protein (UPF0264 family)